MMTPDRHSLPSRLPGLGFSGPSVTARALAVLPRETIRWAYLMVKLRTPQVAYCGSSSIQLISTGWFRFNGAQHHGAVATKLRTPRNAISIKTRNKPGNQNFPKLQSSTWSHERVQGPCVTSKMELIMPFTLSLRHLVQSKLSAPQTSSALMAPLRM